jgi:hypothetical protein
MGFSDLIGVYRHTKYRAKKVLQRKFSKENIVKFIDVLINELGEEIYLENNV